MTMLKKNTTVASDANPSFHRASTPVGSQSRRCTPKEERLISGESADGSISTNAAAVKASDLSTPAATGALSVWPQRMHSSTVPGAVSGTRCSSPQCGQPMASDGGEGRLRIMQPGQYRKTGLAPFAH